MSNTDYGCNTIYVTGAQHVKKAGGADSNGIDADRATTNTYIQYNYVHHNGDGILLCQFAFGDPLFVSIGAWLTGDTSVTAINKLEGLLLQNSSPAINSGMELSNNAGIDFFDNPLYNGGADIGLAEMP